MNALAQQYIFEAPKSIQEFYRKTPIYFEKHNVRGAIVAATI